MADSTYLVTFSEYLGIRSKSGAMAIHARYSVLNALDLLTMEEDPNDIMHLQAPNTFLLWTWKSQYENKFRKNLSDVIINIRPTEKGESYYQLSGLADILLEQCANSPKTVSENRENFGSTLIFIVFLNGQLAKDFRILLIMSYSSSITEYKLPNCKSRA